MPRIPPEAAAISFAVIDQRVRDLPPYPLSEPAPHGDSRQLDGVRLSLNVLPEVVAAVGSQIEVLMDDGRQYVARGRYRKYGNMGR
jgi:hypothetical protein